MDVTSIAVSNNSPGIPQVKHSSSDLVDFNGDGAMDLAVTGLGSPTGEYGMFLFTSACAYPTIYNADIQSCTLCEGIWNGPTNCSLCPNSTYFLAALNNSCILCKGIKLGNANCKPCSTSQFFNVSSNTCEVCDGIVSHDLLSCSLSSSSPSSPSSINIGTIIGSSVGGVGFLLLLLFFCLCCFIFCCFLPCVCFFLIILIILLCIIFLILILLIICSFIAGLVLVRKKSKIPADLYDYDKDALNEYEFQYREIPFSELSLLVVLGSGASGSVYKGRWRNALVAVKHVPLDSSEALKSIRSELQVMSSLGNHPNIIPFIGACTSMQDSLYIVLKFCEQGSLYDYLLVKKSKLSSSQRSVILLQSASALEFLHSKNVIHRDIATRNYLLANPFIVYLADFGLSRLVEIGKEGEAQKTVNNLGPIRWMAPESIFHSEYSTKSDSYMYAMFVYEVLFRVVPFSDESNLLDVTEMVSSGIRPTIPSTMVVEDSFFLDFFHKCWSSDPFERFSMSEIVELWNGKFEKEVESTIPTPKVNALKSSVSQIYINSMHENDQKSSIAVVQHYVDTF